MKLKLNNLTGEFDLVPDSGDYIEKLNPWTGEYNLTTSASSYKQVFNPVAGDFNLYPGSVPSYIIKEVTGNGYINLTNAVANHLMELKAYGGTEQRNLPSGYTQLEYIQGSGTQYIDTGIKLNQNNTVEVKYCYHVESSTLTSGRIFGARYSSGSKKSFSIGTNNGKVSADTNVFGQFGDGIVNAVNNIVIGQRDTYKVSADGFYVNGVKQGSFPAATFETPFTVKLFAFEQATSSSGTPSIGCGTGRCKEFKVLNGDTLVMDLIPARNTSNVIGMYDLVSGQFFANAGTGTFTAGPDVVPTPTAPIDIVSNNGAIKIRRQSGLPINYQMVEWIKSTGPIVITDFKTKSTQEITTVLYREAAGAAYLYASDTATSGTTNTTAYLTSGGGNWRWDGRFVSIVVPFRTEITSVQSADGVYINDTEYPYANPGEFVSTSDLRISSNENTTIRIYSMTIREGETVTLDLVPVQRLSDSTYGFYDKVSGNFYTNSEATFVAGDTISDPVEIYTDGTTETIWSHGKNLLNVETAISGKVINNTTGAIVDNSNYSVSDKLYLPNGTYTFSQTNSATGSAVVADACSYDSNDNPLNLIYTVSGEATLTQTFTLSGNYSYIRIAYRSATASNVQLELGSTATDYEPYYNGGTATAEMLLKVGDYVDEQEILTGNIARKVGIKVLDGTETFTVSSSRAMIMNISDVLIGAENIPMNTHFALETSATSIAVGKQRFGANGTKIYSTNYYMKHATITTATDFKAWLTDQYNAGTPVIVVYPLNTPTTESVAGQTMNIQSGTNIIEITQASIDNLGLYAKYKATA